MLVRRGLLLNCRLHSVGVLIEEEREGIPWVDGGEVTKSTSRR